MTALSTPDRLKTPLFLAGHDVQQTGNFDRLSFAELVQHAQSPSVGPKSRAAWFAPYDAEGKTKADALQGTFNALVLDHDTDNRDLWDLAADYGDFERLIYSTSSHLQTDERHPEPLQRWKVVIPFSQGITAEQFEPLAIGAALLTGTDPAQVRLQQIAFCPNKLTEAAPYEMDSPTGAPLLDPLDASHPFVAAALEQWERYQVERQRKANKAVLKPRDTSDTKGGIIDKVNASYRLSEVLESFGYARKGRAFLAPSSESGIPGVYILRGDDGRERAYSHHSNDPLADGHAHDVFSVLAVLQFNGDQAAAVRHFAETLDKEANDQRRREYMQEKEREETAKAFPTITDPNATEWPELVELDHRDPEPLPVHLWPERIRDYAAGVSAATETPPDLAAVLALGAVATSVQTLANVRIKPGYLEPLNLYAAAGLPPALRKSAVFKMITRPFVAWESDQRHKIQPEIKKAEALLRTHNDRMKELRKQAAKAKDDSEAQELAEQLAELELNAPVVPKVPRAFTGDVTTEALAILMGDNAESGALMSSEGGIFETMAGRYANNVPNIDLYLQAHAGDPVRIDRSGKPPLQMDNPRLSMVLAVQPDVLRSLSNKPGFAGRGLLGRFLYVVPPSNLGQRSGQAEELNPFVEMEYQNLIRELLDASRKHPEKRHTIDLSRGALDAWEAFWRDIEGHLGEGGMFEHCLDWAGKLPGAVARIAGVLHFARHGREGTQGPVSVEDMNAAIATGRALITHALNVYGMMAADPDVEDAKAILRWVKRKGLAEFTERDCHRGNQSKFPRAADLQAGLGLLAERGYIRKVQPLNDGTGRPKGPLIQVNPAVL